MACAIEWLVLTGFVFVANIYFSYRIQQDDRPEKESNLPLLCYFTLSENWPNNGTMHPAMNATLCTHMIMICTSTEDSQIAFSHPDDGEKYFSKVPVLRKQNPDLKIIVCNCGNFDDVLGSAENRTRFTKSIIPFMKKYDLDGLDIDWEFPGWNNRPREQRINYTLQLLELRDEFDREAQSGKKYTLSAAVAAGRSLIEIYNVTAMARSLDFINLMCYDFHAYADYDPVTGYNSPLYPTDWWKKLIIISGNVGWSSFEWHRRGMPKSKIMVGIPTYAHTWTLEKPDKYHGLNAPAIGIGKDGDEQSYPWVCQFLKTGATRVYDSDAAVPYAYKGDQWVSYDDTHSLMEKAKWIRQYKFGGIMVYAMNDDDYEGICNEGKFPLLSTIKNISAIHDSS